MRTCERLKVDLRWIGSVVILMLLWMGNRLQAQDAFTSLRLPSSALMAALGGVNVSLTDRTPSLFSANPALNSDSLDGWGEVSYLFYFANVGMANFSLQKNWGKLGSLSIGVQHLSFGSIDGYDWVGQPLGKYRAGETAIVIGRSHQVQQFRLGVSMRFVSSQITGFRASAFSVDLGGVYVHPSQQLTAGLAFKNLGLVVNDYTATSASSLPFDIQAGVTVKPEHMPVRFSITCHRLNNFDTPYQADNVNFERRTTLDKVVSHLNLASEILLHRNINLLFGYQFLRHQELRLENVGGGPGFTVGAVARVKQMELTLSRAGYPTGGSYQFSISNNLSRLF